MKTEFKMYKEWTVARSMKQNKNLNLSSELQSTH